MKSAAGLQLWHNARIATLADDTTWGLVENGALVVAGRHLAWVGPGDALPPTLRAQLVEEHDLHGALITPGLADCHTHLIYGGGVPALVQHLSPGVSPTARKHSRIRFS